LHKPEDLRSKAKEVFDAVQSNWKVYVSKDNAFRQSRSDLAAALINARQLLDEAGKKRLFHCFLEAKGIPRSTAYDLIKDYERAEGAPEILKIAAELEGLDLTAQRHAVQLQQVFAFCQRLDYNVSVTIGTPMRDEFTATPRVRLWSEYCERLPR
jgi:hypothetical protein